MKKNTQEVLKVGALMISIIISCILATFIIVRDGSLFLKICTAIFFLVCWFLNQKTLINRKIFSLMLINMCALELIPGISYQDQHIAISIISLLLAILLLYRVLQMTRHKNMLKGIFSSIFYTIFGMLNILLINNTHVCILSILATINFAILAHLSTTSFQQEKHN